MVHDGHALPDVIRAVAADCGPLAFRIFDLPDDLQFAGIVIKLRLDIGEAIDAADDLGGVLAKSVENDPQRLLPGLVGVANDADGALGGGKGLVARQKREALRLVPQQHSAQITVAKAHLALLGYGAGDAERLQADADGLRRFGSGLHALFQCNGRAHAVGPAGVFKADGLDTFHDLVGVEARGLADVAALLHAGNSVLRKDGIDFVDSSLVAFKQSHGDDHFLSSYLIAKNHSLKRKWSFRIYRGCRSSGERLAIFRLCLRYANTILLLLFLTGVDVFDSAVPLSVMGLGLL